MAFRTVARNGAEIMGWLASRQPAERLRSDNRLERDVTQLVCDKLSKRKQLPVAILYDNRFVVKVEVGKLPLPLQKAVTTGKALLFLKPQGRWVWPSLTAISTKTNDEEILCTLPPDYQGGDIKRIMDGVSIQWIRPLDDI